MSYYKFFIILGVLNLILFIMFLKLAKNIGFIDKSKKFDNPITVTSSGFIIYLNFLTLFILYFFFEPNLFNNLPNNFHYTLISVSILILISTLDDIRPVDPKIRLFFQLICVYASLTSIPIYQIELPLKVSIFICLSIWVYFINITNFTDGSDGFLAVNTIFVFSTLIFLSQNLELNLFTSQIAIYLLPSIIVFLYFNKPIAKMYLGDSGSIFLGFLNGYIFLELMLNTKFNLAISLFIYPLLDCSLALTKKTLAGQLPWADTSNYSFLQPTIKNNKNKSYVFFLNFFFNLLNTALIICQLFYGWFIIIFNIILTIIFMVIYDKK